MLLFNESYVAGGGTLGYLAADGERVSAGTAVAEVYSDASQAALRQQLTQLGDQIDLLQNRRMLPQPSWTPCGKSVPPPCMT